MRGTTVWLFCACLAAACGSQPLLAVDATTTDADAGSDGAAVTDASDGVVDAVSLCSDGWVHDDISGRCWTRCAHGQSWNGATCDGALARVTFAAAQTTCPIGRLPTRLEYMELLDNCDLALPSAPGSCASCAASARCAALFDSALEAYWTSDAVPNSSPAMGWYANLALSWIGHYAVVSTFPLRCVE